MLFCVSGFAAPEGDEQDFCGELIEFLGLQTHHAKVRQWGRVPTRDLENRIAILKKRLFSGEAPRASQSADYGDSPTFKPQTDWSPDTDAGFEPYREWQPDAGFGDWSPESERDQEEGKPASPTEANFFAMERELAQLEEYLASHEHGDAEARVDAVFRRIAVERFYKAGTYKRDLDNAGVLLPSQQQLTLELWMFETSRAQREGRTLDTKQIARFADVVNLTSDEALRILAEMDFSERRENETDRVRTFHEVMGTLSAGRGDYTPGSLVVALRRFRNGNHPYPTETFGKLLQYFLANNDELATIHDAASLHTFLVAHQE